MKRSSLASLVLVALLALPACDSNSDDDDLDARRLAGAWALTDARVDGSPYTNIILARYDGLVFTFTEETRRFSLYGDIPDTSDDLQVTGRYSVDAGDREIVLLPDVFDAIVMRYAFSGEERVTLSSDDDDSDLLELLLGIDLLDVDEVAFVIERDVEVSP